jgi:hypothetical protein
VDERLPEPVRLVEGGADNPLRCARREPDQAPSSGLCTGASAARISSSLAPGPSPIAARAATTRPPSPPPISSAST